MLSRFSHFIKHFSPIRSRLSGSATLSRLLHKDAVCQPGHAVRDGHLRRIRCSHSHLSAQHSHFVLPIFQPCRVFHYIKANVVQRLAAFYLRQVGTISKSMIPQRYHTGRDHHLPDGRFSVKSTVFNADHRAAVHLCRDHHFFEGVLQTENGCCGIADAVHQSVIGLQAVCTYFPGSLRNIQQHRESHTERQKTRCKSPSFLFLHRRKHLFPFLKMD
jgi:hypothetical protein